MDIVSLLLKKAEGRERDTYQCEREAPNSCLQYTTRPWIVPTPAWSRNGTHHFWLLENKHSNQLKHTSQGFSPISKGVID